MFSLKIGLVSFTVCSLFSSSSFTALAPLQAQTESIPANCQLLKEVRTGATEITKKIQALGITNNFNTDFGIPSGVAFTSYQAMMRVENNANYDVTINLKYGDNSVSTALEKPQIPMVIGENYALPFNSPTDRQPYQINFNIAGPNNNTYTISVMACE
ncbi:hypothetical protein [Gloeocapsa sp. PCC 73106]|uniref:hypothetical protein n=1 Tax=Gloeocapsa sp. PCC 73106 TaxID=102232 RepID=UPI0002ACDE70|nr:hypothetical protein [Gloeocapsa sp. PCC 73106]ELR96807.1 hypothetical protein GLO73106DRAFT_00006060 [Gloeocapsa sp. PCC 73106]